MEYYYIFSAVFYIYKNKNLCINNNFSLLLLNIQYDGKKWKIGTEFLKHFDGKWHLNLHCRIMRRRAKYEIEENPWDYLISLQSCLLFIVSNCWYSLRVNSLKIWTFNFYAFYICCIGLRLRSSNWPHSPCQWKLVDWILRLGP